MGRRRAFYLDDEEVDSILERRSSDDEYEEKAYKRRGPYSDSESGKEGSDKRKGSHHENKSREKIAQKIVRRRKGQDNANGMTDSPS